MGASVRHRFVYVRCSQHAARLAERVAMKRAVVAGAVQPFVMCPRHGGQRGKSRRSREHALRVVRMQAHPLPFAAGEWTWLVPDTVRHGSPAEVVDQTGVAQLVGCA